MKSANVVDRIVQLFPDAVNAMEPKVCRTSSVSESRHCFTRTSEVFQIRIIQDS